MSLGRLGVWLTVTKPLKLCFLALPLMNGGAHRSISPSTLASPAARGVSYAVATDPTPFFPPCSVRLTAHQRCFPLASSPA
ncbi:hypothetical protein BD779DRAFT_1556814 [Infundibulicybe gibba]|nr:hypothetical protein BD779DRAFT_1556814 [Infundibulicybe gibba]